MQLNQQPAKAESALNKFLSLSLDLFCTTGEDGYFQQLNPAWENVLGWTETELRSQPWIEWVHPHDVKLTLNTEVPCSPVSAVEYENRYRHRDGSYRWLSWRVSKAEDGLFYKVAKDITAAKQAEATLRERLEFEWLVTTLSTQFIRLSSEEIDRAINHALHRIGEFAGFDRSYVVLFCDNQAEACFCNQNGSQAELAYEWYAEPLEPLSAVWNQLPTELCPWWREKLNRLEPIKIFNLDELPPQAPRTRQLVQLVGAQSIVAVPMVQGKSVMGYIGFVAVKAKKTLSQEIVALLKIVGEIVANALNRKQAESKLRESERRFRAVFDQTFQFSSLLKLDGTVLEDNQTAIDFCQLERSEIVGHPFWELKCWTISPDTQEQLKQAIAQAVAGQVVRYEADILAPDNSVITIDFSLKPLKDETGRVELLMAEGRDLMGRKRAEEALRTSEAKFRSLSACSPVGIFLADVEGRCTYANPRLQAILNLSLAEMVEQRWVQVIHPEDREQVLATWSQCAPQGQECFQEYRFRTREGIVRWVQVRTSPMLSELGELIGHVGTVEDITERKQAEEALRRSEKRFRLAVDYFPGTLVIYDARRRFQFVNAHGIRLSGMPESALLGHTDEEIFPPEITHSYLPLLLKAVETKQQQDSECTILMPTGGRQTLIVAYVPLLDEQGEIYQILAITYDISDRKQAETILQQVMLELETRVQERTAELQRANEQLSAEIAERKQAEAALRQSEAQFRRVFEEAPFGMGLVSQDRGFFRVNQSLLNMLGYSESELTCLSCENITHPEDWEQIIPYVERVWQGEIDSFKREQRFLKKNQEIIWANLTSMVLRDPSGEILYSMGMVEDITEQKQAEAALRHSEEQFRRVFDEAPIGMSIAGLDNRYIRVNRAFHEMLGYTQSELMALSFLDITHPEDLDLEIPCMEQLVRGESDRFSLEKRYLTHNQATIWVNLTLIALRDRAGDILYTLAMIEDITERKQAEEALQQSEARYRAIVEDQTELICRYRPDGTLTFVNDAYCRYFNKQPSDLIGNHSLPVVPDEDQEIIAQSFSTLSIQQPIVTYEHRVILPSGEIRWQQWTDRALFDDSGYLIECQAVGRDITKLKQAEAEIVKALAKERELSELRSSFVSLVSHEFRTPLTTIQSSAELLERYNHKLSDDKKQNHYRRIQNAVQRMTQLLEDILTIGKAEAGKLNFEPSSMDVVAFCRELVESMQMSLQQRHNLNFVVIGDCTNAPLDEKLLSHILTNLISNAIKYSPDGGVVQFDLVCNPESVVFRIQDSGIGIPSNDIKRLFESFGRASNVGTIPGTGLGLAIVKRCVDLHRGTIVVDSEVGVGTTVTVTLPSTPQVFTDVMVKSRT
ncbi:MAG TPA: PAS domain S-box protein [Waterburya sp.]